MQNLQYFNLCIDSTEDIIRYYLLYMQSMIIKYVFYYKTVE